MSRAPPRYPRGGNASDAALDREAVAFKHRGQIFRCLEFLISKLAETEDGVVDHLPQLAPCLDAVGHKRFECFDLRSGFARLLCQRSVAPKQECGHHSAGSDVGLWRGFSWHRAPPIGGSPRYQLSHCSTPRALSPLLAAETCPILHSSLMPALSDPGPTRVAHPARGVSR